MNLNKSFTSAATTLWLLSALFVAGSAATQALAQGAPSIPKLSPTQLFFRCLPEAEAEQWALADLRSGSAGAQEADIAAGRKAVDVVTRLRAKVLAGEPVEEPYKGASRLADLAKKATSASVVELFRRTAEDQFAREHVTAANQRSNWAAGLSDNARAYAYKVVSAKDRCGTDESNTAWLKGEIARAGWFTISRFGAEADNAAWLLTQHADKDPAFQAQVLTMLEQLAAQGETNRKNYAYLYDRVAVGAHRPQRYGTQGRCTGPATWEPMEMETPGEVDERRRSVGLGPEAEYKATFVSRCAQADLPRL